MDKIQLNITDYLLLKQLLKIGYQKISFNEYLRRYSIYGKDNLEQLAYEIGYIPIKKTLDEYETNKGFITLENLLVEVKNKSLKNNIEKFLK